VSHHAARSPKSDDASKEAFRELVPDDPRVSVRNMFGSLAAFAGDQMFMGLFGRGRRNVGRPGTGIRRFAAAQEALTPDRFEQPPSDERRASAHVSRRPVCCRYR